MHKITGKCVLFLWIHVLTFVKSQNCTLQQFLKNPELYDKNFDTTTLAASYPGGKQVRVGCVVGYSGFFKLLCVEGRWQSRGTKCQPRSCGHPGDAQFADFHLAEGEDFVFGSQVVYTCHKGYQMVSRTTYRRCMAEGWDGVVPVCQAQSCPVINVPDNVLVNGDTEEATYGNVVRFGCKSSNEVLSGSDEMYCDENGEWTGTVPKCEAITCRIPNIENGYVPPSIAADKEFKEHEVLHYACNQLYKRAEERPSKCTKLGGRAEFSPTPACEPIKCKLDLPKPQGTWYNPQYKNVFSPGERLTVRCGERHWISHPRDTSAEVTCKADGEWTMRPVCQEVTCTRFQPHVTSWGNRWGQIKLDDTSSYWCESGYKKPRGVNQATCTREGWTPNPLCEEITCNREDVENADIVGRKLVYKFNEQADYTCRVGYRGNPHRICKERGWTGRSRCTEITCKRTETIQNAEIVDVRDTYKYNEKAKYRCKEGFVGSPTRTCSDNRWTGESQCTAVTCKREDYDYARIHGHVRATYRYKDQVEYICKNGLEGQFTLTCGQTGWIGSPECSTCPKAEVQNGLVVMTSNDTLYYTCNKGYKHLTKGWWGEAKCEDRKWSGLGECIEESKCGEIPEIPNGAMTPQHKVYEQDQYIEVVCKKGYLARLHWLICRDGNWDFNEFSPENICTRLPNNCKSPPKVENAVVVTPYQEEYSPNSEVAYQCRHNYAIKGGNTLRCSNGEWEEKNIMCTEKTKCGEIPEIPNGAMTQHDVYVESIKVICEEGYQAQTPSLTCLEGNWNLNGLSPDAICTRPIENPQPQPERIDSDSASAQDSKESQ